MPGHRRLPTRTLEPASALARGPALLNALESEAVSFWTRVSQPALVLGRAARDPKLDHAAIAAAGLSVHQRASGGGAVLWDHGLVALDVLLPAGHPLLLDDIVASYEWLGDAVRDALGDLGVNAEVVGPEQARATPPPRSPIIAQSCFGGISPGELLVGGRKVAGLCQVRRTGGALFQLGLARKLDGAALVHALGGDSDDACEFAERTHAIKATSEEALVAAVEARIDAVLGDPHHDVESVVERDAVDTLARSRFGSR